VRDPFASVRKNRPIRIAETGRIGTVRPDYPNRIVSQLPMTVRGGFGIGQVRDVVPSTETATRQWTTAESAPDWCAETVKVERPPATETVNGKGIPQWYSVYVRGATPTWPDPDAYDQDVYFADHRERCEWGPTNSDPLPPGPVEDLIL
jgi:hypothetical protein